jgi:erythromycin 3''-O-methyltransferase
MLRNLFFSGSNYFYDLMTEVRLGEQTRFLNFGYWTSKTKSYDEASQQLALKLSEFGAVSENQTLVSVGCGFGDDVRLWQEHYQLAHSVGVNIYYPQLHIARETKMQNVTFCQTDATHLSFQANSFDRVLALESAIHFQPREDFFKEAYRILKPNGVLCIADVVLSQEKIPFLKRLSLKIACRFTKIPNTNHYSWAVYQQKLIDSGFVDIAFEDISKNVFRGFWVCLAKKYRKEKFNGPVVAKILTYVFSRNLPARYILVRATKSH